MQLWEGKWYHREPLPRWQTALHGRTDGLPLWHDDTLLADPWADAHGKDLSAGVARSVLTKVASGLGLPPGQVRPAYEDPLRRLAAKVRMPAGDAVEADDDLGGGSS